MKAAVFATVFMLCAVAARADEPIAVDPALCRLFVKHVPDANVTYQPGVDVYGKPVAPADIEDQSRFRLQTPLVIPLNVQLAKVLNLNYSQFPFNAVANNTNIDIGTLTVEGERVLYNGQPLSDEQQDNLAVLCLKQTNHPPPAGGSHAQ